MEHLLFRIFIGIYILILSSAQHTSHEDLMTLINDKFDQMERKMDMINTNMALKMETITEELALTKGKLESIENGIQSVRCDSSLNEVMDNSTGGSWKLFKNACIKDNKYKKLSNVTVETCKRRCREEGGGVCKSITYHPSTKTCHLSGLGTTSDAYTQPCYLHGYDLYEYTERQCPKGYFNPQGSNQCYIGCPDGFFMLPAPSYQCLKFFNGSTLTWDDANTRCLEEGLVMARPYDALTARQYITEKYGAVGVETAAWIGARGNGIHIAWQSGEQVSPSNPLWWPGHPISSSTDRCLRLLSDDHHTLAYPFKPFADHPCTENRRLNALCELVMK